MITITLKNSEIYSIAEYYNKFFKACNDTYFPAKLNFCIHKNFQKILDIVESINDSRQKVILHYGVQQSDGSYQVDQTNLPAAQAELDELSNIEQDIKIYPISIEELDKIKLTPAQYEALEFMINTNELKED